TSRTSGKRSIAKEEHCVLIPLMLMWRDRTHGYSQRLAERRTGGKSIFHVAQNICCVMRTAFSRKALAHHGKPKSCAQSWAGRASVLGTGTRHEPVRMLSA